MCKHTLLIYVPLFVQQDPTPSPSVQSCSQGFSSNLYTCQGGAILDTLHLSLLNLIRFLWAHFSTLSKFPWMASLSFCSINCTTRFTVISKPTEGALDPLPRSLIKMLKRTGTKTDPWEALLVADFHLAIELLTATLWLWTSYCFGFF